jgi:hypothetical protein
MGWIMGLSGVGSVAIALLMQRWQGLADAHDSRYGK